MSDRRIEWMERRFELPRNQFARHEGEVKALTAELGGRTYIAHRLTDDRKWELCEDTADGWRARGYLAGHIIEGLATRSDIDLVLEADSRGLRRQLREHHTEASVDASSADSVAHCHCSACDDLGGFANVGEAAAAGRDHWRAHVREAIAEYDLKHAT